MNSTIIGNIQGVDINLIEGPAGEEIVQFTADMDIDNDGSGGNPEHDQFHQDDTTLHDPNDNALNAYRVPFIVVPPLICQKTRGKVLGSSAIVENIHTGESCEAVVGDIGPHKKIGEASPALAREISVNPNPVTGGEERRIIRYTIYVDKPAVIDGVTYTLESFRGN
jgi:hypothetical protein